MAEVDAALRRAFEELFGATAEVQDIALPEIAMSR
jgi:hypothetical protein